MAQFEGSIAPAIDAYRRAVEAGVDRELALDVALAKLRASYPGRDEWTLRSWLAKGLVEARRVEQLVPPMRGSDGTRSREQ